MDEDYGFYLFIGFMGGILVGFLISAFLDNTSELGQAICEEKYGMDYGGFSDGVLECKPKPQLEEYDGIRIKINKMEYENEKEK